MEERKKKQKRRKKSLCPKGTPNFIANFNNYVLWLSFEVKDLYLVCREIGTKFPHK